jgi:hypothetical protein
MGQRFYTQDKELIFADGAAAVVASGAGQVASADKIIDLGAGRFEGVMLFDVSAVKISANDELYRLAVQGSNDAGFASGVQCLAMIDLGATEVRDGGAIDSVLGRYEVPFCTEQANVVYRYARVYAFTNGTSESITYKAWCATKY